MSDSAQNTLSRSLQRTEIRRRNFGKCQLRAIFARPLSRRSTTQPVLVPVYRALSILRLLVNAAPDKEAA